MGRFGISPPVKFKSLNRLSQNLSQLIKSTRGTFIPSLVKIRSRGTSGQIGEMSLSCDFFIYFFFWCTRRDQTLWPILTHYGSKCAESRKDVPFGIKIFNFNIWPLFTSKMSNFAPIIAISSENGETYGSPSISDITKAIDLKIWQNVKNVKWCSQMQYDDVTTNPIWRTAAILKNVFWLYLRPLLFD